MTLLLDIKRKIALDQFEFTKHAVDQSILRQINMQEFREAISNSEILEDYPEDKYGPSCLMLGYTRQGRPLHIHCTYPSRPFVKIITVYEPDPTYWFNHRIRRTPDE